MFWAKDRKKLDRVIWLTEVELTSLNRKVAKMALDIQKLIDDVTKQTSVVASAVTAFQGLSASIADLKTQLAAADLIDALELVANQEALGEPFQKVLTEVLADHGERAPSYNPKMVEKILAADAAPPEAAVKSGEELMRYLDDDGERASISEPFAGLPEHHQPTGGRTRT